MKMSLDKLLQNNDIVQTPINDGEIKAKMEIAKRDLSSAKKIIKINQSDTDDTAYVTAYHAILEAGYALVYSKGYHVKARGKHHWIVQQFIESEFSSNFDQDVLLALGQGRQTRNTLQYDSIGIITHSDIIDLIEKAEIFVTVAKRILNIQ